jgi:CheY-like chemotaxis protein
MEPSGLKWRPEFLCRLPHPLVPAARAPMAANKNFSRRHGIFCFFGIVRVLIADDEIGFSTVLADLVRSCGHEVVAVVHSGLDAIRSYRQHKPDVVLMDFAMARLNGLTACRNILSDDPEGCVLFLSGLSERAELTPEYSGAAAVLQKPITRVRLEQVLNDAASRRQSAPKNGGTVPVDSAPDSQS